MGHARFRGFVHFAGALTIALLFPSFATARDDVPEEIASQTNHVTNLTPRDIRYYEKQFKAKCARCHGLDGSGGGEDSSAQAVPPADFTDAGYMSTRSDGQLFYQILMGGGEQCAMPAFGPGSDHGWGENKIWYMVAFVRRFSEPPSD
jgi:mono/diheme cytochrome c family protein